MSHRGDGLNDIFEGNVLVRGDLSSNKSVIAGDYLKAGKSLHAYGGFENKPTTITLAVDTYAQVTNITGDLWEGLEVDGITLLNDQMIFANTADYFGNLAISVSGLPGKDFHFRIYNITQSKVMGYEMGISTTGAANNTVLSMPLYFEVDKDDVLEVQVKSTDGTDAVLMDSIFYIVYLHE